METWMDKVARGERPLWMPEDLDGLEWTEEELAAAEKAIAPLRPSLVLQEAKREGSSLFIMPKLVSQMLGYQRDLNKSFDEMIAELAAAAGTPSNNQFTGFSEGDEEAKAAIAAATVAMLGAAASAFVGAYQTGRDLGMDITGRAVVSPQEQEIKLAAQLRKNASYVTQSLMADVEAEFQQIVRDPMLPPEKAAAAVEAMGESMAGRVTMYARPLWGLGHQGFAEEMVGAGKLLDWVVTSTNTCPDCPKLAALGPWGGLRQLPTYPGAGETTCRTNCLCLLVEVATGTIAVPLPVTGAMTVALAPPDYGITRRQVRELRREEIRAMLDEFANKLLARKARTTERSASVQKGLELMAGQMGDGFKALARAIEKVASRPPDTIVVKAPNVQVDVAAPAPVVVPAPEVRVEVAAAPAPEVTVDVHVPEPRLRQSVRTVERDEDKLVTKVVEREEFAE